MDPNSDALVRSIGIDKSLHPDFGTVYQGAPNGIPYVVVSGDQPKVKVQFSYADESDPGPYPIPKDAPIEGGPTAKGDRHVLVIDRDNWKLYELFSSQPQPDGSWKAGSGAIFDLKSNALRPEGWTSCDAAGLPIFPGLVRYDEVVEQKEIRHALRFTVVRSRRAYVPPARHYASSRTEASLPPMGMRVRLKSSVDISKYPPSARVILTALQRYGMIVADNGGDWFISGAPTALGRRRHPEHEGHPRPRLRGDPNGQACHALSAAPSLSGARWERRRRARFFAENEPRMRSSHAATPIPSQNAASPDRSSGHRDGGLRRAAGSLSAADELSRNEDEGT